MDAPHTLLVSPEGGVPNSAIPALLYGSAFHAEADAIEQAFADQVGLMPGAMVFLPVNQRPIGTPPLNWYNPFKSKKVCIWGGVPIGIDWDPTLNPIQQAATNTYPIFPGGPNWVPIHTGQPSAARDPD